ncbi:alkaline phosphatase family protein [Longispora albida]|uniref:alkaline phosphatase family protein n=1 Tax=Longispora albida TaxID=203523 RepID=UPI00037F4191|nr:alkaline phosphatase family protein [Longispora albida]
MKALTRGLVAASLLAAALTAAPAGAAPAAVTAKTPKVLVVGMDGLNWAKVVQANAPRLDALAASGTLGESMLYCGPMAASSSGPGWSTIATGVWPDKHGVKDNSFSGKQYGTYPDFLTRIERASSAFGTFSVLDWAVLHTQGTFGTAIDTRITYDGDRDGYVGSDAKVTADAVRILRDTNPDAGFVYLGNTDVVAHASGTGSAYLAAIEKQDAQLGQLLDTITARPSYATEDWKVVVTTDHGHVNPGGGHGGCGIDERRTFVLTSAGGGLRPVDVKLVDVAATALAHLGLSAPIDGKPAHVRSADPFDGLYGSLQSRVDETGIPSGVKGFTHTTPPGWSITQNMPSGGVTEWRGWSFTTDEFWTRTQASQYRELNVRARGVFAVADSDEFADKAGGASYDSTLISPAFAVTGGSQATLRYVTHYMQEGSQTGDVSVSFNGGAPQLVKRYSADAVAKDETVTVSVPAGATSVKVHFRYYNASNNWFWVIDDLRVA